MNNDKLNNALNNYISPKKVSGVSQDGMEREECDLRTVNVTLSGLKTVLLKE